MCSAKNLHDGAETIVAYCSLSEIEILELEEFLIKFFTAHCPKFLLNKGTSCVSQVINDDNTANTVYRVYFTFLHGVSEEIEMNLIAHMYVYIYTYPK